MAHVSEELSAYLDEQLPAEERERVDAHLTGCAACRAELDELRGVSKMMAALPRRPLPVGFIERLNRKRSEKPSAAPWLGWLGVAPQRLALSMATVLVAFVAFEYSKTLSRQSAILESDLSSPDSSSTEAAREMADELAALRSDQAAASAGKAGGGGSSFTNENQQAYLELQKKKLGIVRILPRSAGSRKEAAPLVPAAPQAAAKANEPETGPMNEQEARRYMAQMTKDIRSTVERMQPPSSAIKGERPALLSGDQEDFAGPIERAPDMDTKLSASNRGKAPSRSVQALGAMALVRAATPMQSLVAPSASSRPEDGAPRHWVARTPQERAALHQNLGKGAVIPTADFSKEMIVAVAGGRWSVEIVEVASTGGQTTVRYRTLPLGGAKWALRVVGAETGPVNFTEVGPPAAP